MRIGISGTIVSPDYDDTYFEHWIEKGVITPSSRFVQLVESAREPIELYVNSYGGDVFAGGEMMVALLKAHATGRLASVEVGSIAASMAANIVAALRAAGAEVTVHANTQIMFHGCYTGTEGGAQHHEDVAASLRNVNDSVIATLNKLGIKECRAWFAEGREKWIGASEAIELNLATCVAGEEALEPQECKKTAARLAALANTIISRKEYSMKIDEQIEQIRQAQLETAPVAEATVPAEPAETAKTVEQPVAQTEQPVQAEQTVEAQETAPEAPTAPAAALDETLEARVQELAQARFSKLQSAHDKMISDLKATIKAKDESLTQANTLCDQLKADLEKAKADLALTRDQLAHAEANREAVVTSALTPVERFDGNAREQLAKLPPSKREAFYKAHRAEIDGIK